MEIRTKKPATGILQASGEEIWAAGQVESAESGIEGAFEGRLKACWSQGHVQLAPGSLSYQRLWQEHKRLKYE